MPAETVSLAVLRLVTGGAGGMNCMALLGTRNRGQRDIFIMVASRPHFSEPSCVAKCNVQQS